MPSLWFVFYGVCAFVGVYAMLDRFILGPRRDRALHGAAWKEYQAGAYHPRDAHPATPGRRRRVLRVGVEMASTGGSCAIQMRAPGWIAVHEVRNDGTFADRGPYFIKRRPCVWTTTGRRHLVEVEEGELMASNPQGGTVHERGVRVHAWNTTQYPPVTLRTYAATARRIAALLADAAAPLPPGESLPRATYERWAAWLHTFPTGRACAVFIPVVMLATGYTMARSGSDPADPVEWGVVLFCSFLLGIAPGLFIGGLLVPSLVRRFVATVHPEARRVWELIQATDRRGRAQRQLMQYLADTASPLPGHLATAALAADDALAAAVARPEPPDASNAPLHAAWVAEALTPDALTEATAPSLHPAWRLMTRQRAATYIGALPTSEARLAAEKAYQRAVSSV
jgi:hypothetical protein